MINHSPFFSQWRYLPIPVLFSSRFSSNRTVLFSHALWLSLSGFLSTGRAPMEIMRSSACIVKLEFLFLQYTFSPHGILFLSPHARLIFFWRIILQFTQLVMIFLQRHLASIRLKSIDRWEHSSVVAVNIYGAANHSRSQRSPSHCRWRSYLTLDVMNRERREDGEEARGTSWWKHNNRTGIFESD